MPIACPVLVALWEPLRRFPVRPQFSPTHSGFSNPQPTGPSVPSFCLAFLSFPDNGLGGSPVGQTGFSEGGGQAVSVHAHTHVWESSARAGVLEHFKPLKRQDGRPPSPLLPPGVLVASGVSLRRSKIQERRAPWGGHTGPGPRNGVGGQPSAGPRGSSTGSNISSTT